MNEILTQRIKERIESLGTSAQKVSTAAGADRTYLASLFKGKLKSPTTEKLAAIAKQLKTTPQYLLGEETNSTTLPRTLPVMGRAAASIVGAENIIEDAIEFTTVPPGLDGVKDAYCLWVEGDSMKPMYGPRDPIFVHPRQPIARGDIVVVQEERDGAVYASVKEFVRRTDSHMITRQYNPANEIKFNLKYIIATHRVLPLREVLNL